MKQIGIFLLVAIAFGCAAKHEEQPMMAGDQLLTFVNERKKSLQTASEAYLSYGGATTPDYEKKLYREEIVRRNPTWPESIKESILIGKLEAGMTKKQLFAAWGTPTSVGKTKTETGEADKFLYGVDNKVSVILQNDQVVSWHDAQKS
jgi:hypothetical protein